MGCLGMAPELVAVPNLITLCAEQLPMDVCMQVRKYAWPFYSVEWWRCCKVDNGHTRGSARGSQSRVHTRSVHVSLHPPSSSTPPPQEKYSSHSQHPCTVPCVVRSVPCVRTISRTVPCVRTISRTVPCVRTTHLPPCTVPCTRRCGISSLRVNQWRRGGWPSACRSPCCKLGVVRGFLGHSQPRAQGQTQSQEVEGSGKGTAKPRRRWTWKR